MLGSELGPPAAASGHNTYWPWRTPEGDGPIIGVGGVVHVLRPFGPELEVVGTIGNPSGVGNEQAGRPLLLCRHPLRSLHTVWPSVQYH